MKIELKFLASQILPRVVIASIFIEVLRIVYHRKVIRTIKVLKD